MFMPRKKKRQHYVPKVYLQPFTDGTPPSGWVEGRPFEPTVWTIDPYSMGSAQRKSPSNILWKNCLYTLASDDPAAPIIEEQLSILESAYSSVRDHILADRQLDSQQFLTLACFIGTLYGRVPPQIDSLQDFIDRIREISSHMSELPPEGMSWADFDQAGLKLIPSRATTYVKLVAQHGFILVNLTDMPFITSDATVTHMFTHVDEAPVRHFQSLLRDNVTPNFRHFFSFMPISPDKAFISSPLLVSNKLYHAAHSIDLIFSLNQFTRHGAHTLVSHLPKPYGSLTEVVIAREAELAASAPPKSGLLVYTSYSRVWVSTHQVNHESGVDPLHSVIRFVSTTLSELEPLQEAEDVVEVTVYQEGHIVGEMRECWLSGVAITSGAESSIESFPGGWESWRHYG